MIAYCTTCDLVNKNCKLNPSKEARTKLNTNGRNNKQLNNIKATTLDLESPATTGGLINCKF